MFRQGIVRSRGTTCGKKYLAHRPSACWLVGYNSWLMNTLLGQTCIIRSTV